MKLTAKQQQVVNLMAAGYVLAWHSSVGRSLRDWSTLRKGDKSHKVPANICHDLSKKGVVEIDRKKNDWRSTVYVLTDKGRSMAQPVSAQKSVAWWCIGKYGTEIGTRQFVSDTDEYLFDDSGSKTKKHSEWQWWLSSREAAVEALHVRLKGAVSAAEYTLAENKKALAAFEKKESL